MLLLTVLFIVTVECQLSAIVYTETSNHDGS